MSCDRGSGEIEDAPIRCLCLHEVLRWYWARRARMECPCVVLVCGRHWTIDGAIYYTRIRRQCKSFQILSLDSEVERCVKKFICISRSTHVSLSNAYKKTVYRRTFVKKPGKQFEMLQLACCHPLRLREFSDSSFLRASSHPSKTSMPSVKILCQS